MKIKIVIALLMLVILAACEKDTLNPNEVYRSRDLKIEFMDFTDSRCPLNANCIWEGEAEVYLKAESGNEKTEFKMTGIGSDTTVFGHKIKFVDLLPYPEDGLEETFKNKELIIQVSKL